MKQYLLSVHHDFSTTLPEDEMTRMFQEVDALNNEMQTAGAWVFGGGLTPPDSATTVRVNGGEVLLTDGPYAETKEVLGGFWVIKAADLDAALAWARRAAAIVGPIEVRPFQDEAED